MFLSENKMLTIDFDKIGNKPKDYCRFPVSIVETDTIEPCSNLVLKTYAVTSSREWSKRTILDVKTTLTCHLANDSPKAGMGVAVFSISDDNSPIRVLVGKWGKTKQSYLITSFYSYKTKQLEPVNLSDFEISELIIMAHEAEAWGRFLKLGEVEREKPSKIAYLADFLRKGTEL